MDYVKKEEVIG